MDTRDWKSWSSLKSTRPLNQANGHSLISEATGSTDLFGGWYQTRQVTDVKDYVIRVEYDAIGIRNEEDHIAVTLEWFDANGDPLAVDYVNGLTQLGDVERLLERTVRTREGAANVHIRLILRHTPTGLVRWRKLAFHPIDKHASRTVRFATTRISPGPGATIERNVRKMEDIIDRAAADNPDLICLTENFVDRGVKASVPETSQPIPGEVVSRLGERAAKHRTYIVTSLHEEENGRYYNTAVLINRSGHVVGKYRKVHLTYLEQMNGLTPGSAYPIFETDFGRLGILICYDMWFPEPARVLALNGAEVIAFPLAGSGIPGHFDHIWPARAMDNGVAVVSSSTGTSPSQILDRTGKVVSSTMGDPPYVSASIDLDQYFGKRGLSVGRAFGEATVLFRKERRMETYGDLVRPEGMRTAKVIEDPDLQGGDAERATVENRDPA